MFLELKVSFPRIEWKAEAEQRPHSKAQRKIQRFAGTIFLNTCLRVR